MRSPFPYLIFFMGLPLMAQDLDESPEEIRMETTIEHLGDVGQFLPNALSIAAIIIHKDDKGAWQLAQSIGANLAATYTLKYLIDKKRPDGATDGKAFPSGHTSFAFQGAAFLHRRYGLEWGIPAYLVAGYVGFSRVEGLNDRHDWIDVLGGAALGISSSFLLAKPLEDKKLDISFSMNSTQYGFQLTYKF